MSINVFIIDDHKILIDSFKDHFSRIKDIDVVGYALSGCEAIEILNPKEKYPSPDIILQDIDLADMSGIECTKAILKINPGAKIIGLSSYSEAVIVKKMMKAGAKGYISKATDIENLELAIRKVHDGKEHIGEHIAMSMAKESVNSPQRKAIIPKVSDRENEVLQLISQELNTKEIGEQLFISPNTVQTHRKNLLFKFDVVNSVGLIRKAIEFGFIKD